ncbi:MAG: holo-ACP synthase [Opitutales bacterium]|nr:holo-ACP synthase [Opitutales bacterium]
MPEIPEGCNVVGVGIDQIEVERVQDSISRHGAHFLTKVFTSKEQEYCQDKANAGPHYAARFAAKEAVSKALGTGFGKKFGWLDAEILNGEAGEPQIYFSPKATELLTQKGATRALVSLTHLESIASSIVILIK